MSLGVSAFTTRVNRGKKLTAFVEEVGEGILFIPSISWSQVYALNSVQISELAELINSYPTSALLKQFNISTIQGSSEVVSGNLLVSSQAPAATASPAHVRARLFLSPASTSNISQVNQTPLEINSEESGRHQPLRQLTTSNSQSPTQIQHNELECNITSISQTNSVQPQMTASSVSRSQSIRVFNGSNLSTQQTSHLSTETSPCTIPDISGSSQTDTEFSSTNHVLENLQSPMREPTISTDNGDATSVNSSQYAWHQFQLSDEFSSSRDSIDVSNPKRDDFVNNRDQNSQELETVDTIPPQNEHHCDESAEFDDAMKNDNGNDYQQSQTDSDSNVDDGLQHCHSNFQSLNF